MSCNFRVMVQMAVWSSYIQHCFHSIGSLCSCHIPSWMFSSKIFTSISCILVPKLSSCVSFSMLIACECLVIHTRDFNVPNIESTIYFELLEWVYLLLYGEFNISNGSFKFSRPAVIIFHYYFCGVLCVFLHIWSFMCVIFPNNIDNYDNLLTSESS